MKKVNQNGLTSIFVKTLVLIIAVAILGLCCIGLIACGHAHELEKVDGKSATCTEEGVKAHWKCKGCDELFSDADGKTATSISGVTIAKSAHNNELIVTVAGGTYIEGTKLLADKLTYSLKCNDCGTTTAVTNNVSVDLTNDLTVGANTFTATYEGLSKPFTVTAVAKTLTDITVEFTGKIVYSLNEAFDRTGLTVTASYNNGQNVDVTSGCSVICDTSSSGPANAEVSYGGKTKYISITVLEKGVTSLTVALNTPSRIFHEGEVVTKNDLTVNADFDDASSSEITDYEIENTAITDATTKIEVSYGGKTAAVNITAHGVTFNPEVESTISVQGNFAHYECGTCGKYYDEDFCELSSVAMPLMQNLSITNSNISITNSNGAKVSTTTESGSTFLSGSPNSYYGRIFMVHNLSVQQNTEIKIYLNMSTRTNENKMNSIFSIKVNGIEIDINDKTILPKGAANNWFSQTYTYAGNATLYAGQNNVIEVTRKNLISSPLGGDKTYNYFGIGITPCAETAITYTDLCTHICEHCGGCTDPESTKDMCANKCEGHDGEHFCESVCNICGDCKDETCTDSVCEDKCGCVVFTVMNSSVTAVDINNATVNKNTGEQNISANDSSAKKGLIKITYSIYSDTATTAKLYIRTCSQTLKNSLADSYGFQVGDNTVTVDPGIMMPQNEANKWNDIRYTYVGEANLSAGTNTIIITRFDMTNRELNDYTGYNFFGIALSTLNSDITWAV